MAKKNSVGSPENLPVPGMGRPKYGYRPQFAGIENILVIDGDIAVYEGKGIEVRIPLKICYFFDQKEGIVSLFFRPEGPRNEAVFSVHPSDPDIVQLLRKIVPWRYQMRHRYAGLSQETEKIAGASF